MANKEPDNVATNTVPGSESASLSPLFARMTQLLEIGMPATVAFSRAELETRVENWPEKWGNYVHVLIFGDFFAPDHDLDYPSVEITVEAGNRTNTFIKAAFCVLNARIKVQERTVDAVLDAIERLHTFLGIWTAMDVGNRGIGWWCSLTHGSCYVGGMRPFACDGLESALIGLIGLPPAIKSKVRAAIYWIREPRLLTMENHRKDILPVYAGYWNAFESLVDAACLARPQEKLNKQAKLDGIAEFIGKRQGVLDVASLSECYRLFANPGFVAKAIHALKICCPENADRYIEECFRAKPESERLYAVRNAINHGDVDFDSFYELMRIDAKAERLQMIVLRMLAVFIPTPCFLDPGPQ